MFYFSGQNNTNAQHFNFVQMRLKVVSITSSAYPSFCSSLTSIAKHWFLIFIFIKSQAAVTDGRNSNATLAQSPNVGGKFVA